MLAKHPVIGGSFPTFFYQFGYAEKPWDSVSHAYDLIPLFGRDADVLNCGKAFSEEFMLRTQGFFGGYIKGVEPVASDGTIASMQNGYYAQIVDEIRFVELSDLDVVRERCEVYNQLGDGIFRHPICMGIFWEDMHMDGFDVFGEEGVQDDKQEM